MSVQTPAFPPGGAIAVKYTCDGGNISPRLLINGVPLNAKSLALVLDDANADGGPLTHWAMWNIPSSATAIAEGTAPPGAVVGTTSFGTAAYTGPCPPQGERHQYVLRLYALDTRLTIPPGAKREEFLRALLGHELEEDEVMGFYRR
ncbi:MAG: YbhB/YbcL family Raf kinase inhibitor-like protein [Candidatus Liptonbacteria bacterium]|nr:YbhB/YbcL family Raf kinase inhibitor-like protein [Candidatus Liptonbacteria bacterium]